MKKNSWNLIILLITILICIIVGEIFLRVFAYTSLGGLRNRLLVNGKNIPIIYDPVQFIETYYQYVSGPGFGHVPSVRFAILCKEHKNGYIIFSTNNMGLREDRNFSKIAPRRKKRILLLGDSHVDGICNNDENLSHVAENIMVSQNISIEIINAGVGFYGPYQCFLGAQRVILNINIDAIILTVYIGNDYLDLLRQEGRSYLQFLNGTFHEVIIEEGDYIPQAHKGGWKNIIQPIRNFAIFRCLETLFRNPNNDPRIGMIPQIFNQTNIFYHQPKKFEQSKLLIEQTLKVIKKWTIEKGYAFIVLILPDANQVARAFYKSRFEKVEENLGLPPQVGGAAINAQVHQHLILTLKKMNLQYIDLLPIFLSYKNPNNLYWETDSHLSVEGHRLAGIALANELTKNKD